MDPRTTEDGRCLLRTLDHIVEVDPDTDELGFVVDTTEPFVCVDHKLGIAFSCMRALYDTARREMFALKNQSAADRCPSRVVSVTRALLCINADCMTAWNIRKEALLLGWMSLHAEFGFLDFLFTKHPKSSEAWAHRRWVVQLALSCDVLTKKDLWQLERRACHKAAERHPKNYVAWTHRAWVMRVLNYHVDLENELEDLWDWNRTHVSDHAGLHHRQTLLERARETWSCSQMYTQLRNEFRNVGNLIVCYPEHEALWAYRRFLFDSWMRFLATCLAHNAKPWEDLSVKIGSESPLWPSLADEAGFAYSLRDRVWETSEDVPSCWRRPWWRGYILWIVETSVSFLQSQDGKGLAEWWKDDVSASRRATLVREMYGDWRELSSLWRYLEQRGVLYS